MNTDNKDQVVQLYLDDIIPNRFQPREVFDEKALKELAVSIKEHGVIQPIIVRNVKGKYEIIAGERRYKASALAGLTKIPAIIRDLDDKESSKVALLENLQRKNLTPIEEARTYQKILEIDEMTQDELAKTMGKSQSSVANKLRLLSLPDEVQDSLLKEQISERHARALLNIPESHKQTEMLKKIIANKMSVRAVEDEIKQLYPKADEETGVAELKPTISPINMSDTITIPSATTLLNSTPLTPTAPIPETKPEYGEIRIVPPTENGVPSPSDKFINYGEIDELDDDDDKNPPMAFNDITAHKDLDALRGNALDINVAKPAAKTGRTADLDSLLNIQNMAMGPAVGHIPGSSPFITPAEKIVKTDNIQKPKPKTQDYFKTADFVPNMPVPQVPANKNTSLEIGIPELPIPMKGYSIEDAVKKVKELVADLKEHGIAIHADEMDFEKSFQVIIKIDK